MIGNPQINFQLHFGSLHTILVIINPMIHLVNRLLLSGRCSALFMRILMIMATAIGIFASLHHVSASSHNESTSPSEIIQTNKLNFSFDLSCETYDCGKPILIELSSGLSLVRIIHSEFFLAVDQNLADNRLTFTPPRNFIEDSIPVTLHLATSNEGKQLHAIRAGQLANGSAVWLDRFELSSSPNSSITQLSPLSPTLFYMSSQLSYSPSEEPLLHLAPANLTEEEIDELAIIIEFPTGITPAEFSWGSFQANGQSNANIPVNVSYQIADSDNWETWGTVGSQLSDLLLNPPISSTLSTGVPLTRSIQMTAIKLELSNIPPGYRWAGDLKNQPTFKLLIEAEDPANWVEVCHAVTGKLMNDLEFMMDRVCQSHRILDKSSPIPNMNLRIETNGAVNNPRPGDTISIIPSLQLTNREQSALDLVVDLPSWLNFITTTGDLEFIPGQPLTSTVSIEPLPEQPSFDQRIAIENGNMRLIWRWPDLTSLNTITMPTIQAELLPGLPVGQTQIPFYVLSNGKQSCWGGASNGRDLLDIDLDQNKEELYCQASANFQIESIAGLTADLFLNGPLAPATPLVANLTIINGGTQPIQQTDVVMPIPADWLIVPPSVPDQYAVAYATTYDACTSVGDCDETSWQFTPAGKHA